MSYRTTAIAAACTIVCFLTGCVTALVALGRDVSQVIYLCAVVAAPTVTALLALAKVEEIRSNQDDIKDAVKKVESNTNGNLSRLMDLLEKNGIDANPQKEDARDG